jgi:acetyl esterase/lipase
MNRYCMSLLLAAVVPATANPQDSSRIVMERDLVFATVAGRELKLNLARPRGEGRFPVVVCLHGGGWVGGDRQQMEQTIKALAARGFAAVSPDYRLAPHDVFPAQVEDCKAVVRWLRANASKWQLDPERIGVLGFAAGGHLACLLGVTAKSDGLDGDGGNAECSSHVQAVVSFFGPTDLARTDWDAEVRDKNLIPLLGGPLEERPDDYRKASPLNYVRKGAPPFLFVHGEQDKVVPLSHSLNLAEKLRAAGGSARVIILEGEDHAPRGERLRTGLAEMIAFFEDTLKRPLP